jgi:hypothetical protein
LDYFCWRKLLLTKYGNSNLCGYSLIMKKLFSGLLLTFFGIALAGAGDADSDAPFKVAYICEKGTRVQVI